jgi:hypothetical protein
VDAPEKPKKSVIKINLGFASNSNSRIHTSNAVMFAEKTQIDAIEGGHILGNSKSQRHIAGYLR